MSSKPLNKGDFCETHVAYRLALINSIAVQTDNLSSKLPTKTHQMHHLLQKNVIFRHHYVMQKNSHCVETEQMSKVIFAEFFTSTAKI